MRASYPVWIALGFGSLSHGEKIFKLHNEPQIMEGLLRVKDETRIFIKLFFFFWPRAVSLFLLILLQGARP